MMVTYVAGAVGLFIGFATVSADSPSLTWAVVLIVVAGGGLSFVRHSIFHRSDAARMGWTSPGRNNFQIEVGIANLSWAAVALVAVILDWGIAVQAATLLTFGTYLAGSAAMLVLSSSKNRSRSLGPVIAMALFGVMQIVLGVLGMSAG
ncbi:MAG: hypothetical protein QG597_102 [Actinomycetota bacterium]|nr:hypothetical protein [Actinomycetota bacterium]